MKPARIALVLAVLVIIAVLALEVLQPAWYLRQRNPLKYPNFIRTHAANYDLPPDLVAAVIRQESDFDELARSSAGAIGLMQITPETAKGIALRTGGHRFEEGDLINPEINIRYGCWYLRHLHRKYDEEDDGFDLALAAYNAGQGQVDRWIAGDDDGTLELDEIPFDETRNYVDGVRRLRADYRKAYPELQR